MTPVPQLCPFCPVSLRQRRSVSSFKRTPRFVDDFGAFHFAEVISMIWRSLRSPHIHPKPAPVNLCLPQSRRWLSNAPITSAYQSIASILDFRPAGGQDGGQSIVVTGHVRTVRKQKRWSFVEIGDGSSSRSLQALVEPSQAIGYKSRLITQVSRKEMHDADG